jgi:Zn-dependent protease
MDANWLTERFIFWIPLVLSLTVHEWAHAATAKALGDDTAQRLGRLSLNPLDHIDPIGTLILPLLGIPFGWAEARSDQSSTVSPRRRNGNGIMLTALAGPASNLIVALVVAGVIGLSSFLSPGLVPSAAMSVVTTLIVLNVMLAFFNLLPIPPLDGSRVVDSVIPDALRPAWDGLAPYGAFALLALIVIPRVAGFDLFVLPQQWAMQLVHIAGG